jgi:RNA 2',3'-cyclic 3'-phosphodiesterase
MRIFVAIPLSQTVRNSLSALRQPSWSAVRWEHPSDFHITLRFIGDVDNSRQYEQYKQVLSTVQPSEFNLTFRGVGHFPADPTRELKVLWAGVELAPELIALQKTISTALEANGLRKDKFSDYNPHITLGRFRQQPSPAELSAFLDQHALFQTEPMPVNAFVIYCSEKAADGSTYQEVERFPFNP